MRTDKPDHTILMREPTGKPSTIRVFHKPDGSADVVFARSSQGELLVRLPEYAVKELALALNRHSAGPSLEKGGVGQP